MKKFPVQPLPKYQKRRIAEIRVANRFLGQLASHPQVDGKEIDTMLHAVQKETRCFEVPMRPALEKLIHWYLQDSPNVQARIIIAPMEASHGSLWLLGQLEKALVSAAKNQPLVLIISGLREWIAGDRKNWTRSRESAWKDISCLLEDKVIRFSQNSKLPVSLLVT